MAQLEESIHHGDPPSFLGGDGEQIINPEPPFCSAERWKSAGGGWAGNNEVDIFVDPDPVTGQCAAAAQTTSDLGSPDSIRWGPGCRNPTSSRPPQLTSSNGFRNLRAAVAPLGKLRHGGEVAGRFQVECQGMHHRPSIPNHGVPRGLSPGYVESAAIRRG